MEIQLYNQNGLAGIPEKDQEISIALESRMINVVPDAELFELFKAGVTAAYAIVRWDAPKGVEYTVMIDQVMRICKKTYGTIREKEIVIAITRGVLGDYGEYMGLSIKSFTWFIKSYLAEESRIKLLAERNKPADSKAEPTLAEQKEAFISRLEQLYEDFKQGRAILPTEGTFYFEKLFSAKVIRLTEDQRNQLKQTAYERLVKAKNPAKSQTKSEHDRMKQVYQAFITSGLEGNDVKREAMYLGLLEWFKGLADFDIQIRDEIE
jgi:hypothetical protein